MADNGGQEKTEQATGKKLSDAREKGQVAKSTEINSLAVFGTGLIILFITKSFIAGEIGDFTSELLKSIAQMKMTQNIVQTYFLKWTIVFFTLLAPVFGGVFVAALASNIAQFGFKFTPKVFEFKLSKFNPIAGLKRIFFSTNSIMELGKSLVKLFIIGLFTYFIIAKLIEDSVALVNLNLYDTVAFMLDSAFALIWKIVLCFTVIATVDFLFQKFKFKKDMMMTKEETKEENKQQEGDPHVKSQIRKKMILSARNRMMQDIPTADVIITNPTHVAIALKYDLQKDAAPKVVAKGLDELAQRIKKLGVDNNVPLHEDVQLARALYKTCEIGDFIPAKLFKAVAQILAYIFQLKKTKKRKSII
ncbi:flagellar biosynthetic protein FlhB [bacterium BRH_c32]|nr:MAG: flagellar biosynthetic protein FlhB [bacterium BRH_c32]